MKLASSSSSSLTPCIYDIFLSFSGHDTRYSFTSHLLDALIRHGFSTFRDDTKLERGVDIRCQIPRAISESRVSIVVFSENYAASEWCLDELVKVMDCRRDLNQVVMPIFYHINPSHVVEQSGSYAKAFKEHESRFKGTSSMERVVRWRESLTDAANLSGWDLQNVANRDEAKLIKIIVEEVTNRLDRLYSDVADHPIGIDSRVKELKSMLKLGSDGICIVSVWGIGGIGKTTIAKALFNCIRNEFEGSSFLADVSETFKTSHGVTALQKQLLSNIQMNETPDLDNYHQGVDVIKRKLRHRRVLLVLDDVDHAKQLKMLAINRDFLCKGSKLIITTRNKSSLSPLQVDSVYSPTELDMVESLKLFSLNAFKMDHPEEGYIELSKEVVAYAGGLPLAIEALGSFFSGRSQSEWASGLGKLKKCPHDDIQGKLKISFESLDKKDKELFLDIAFFFIGKEKDFTVKVLEDLECFPEIGIAELARRCLVRVDMLNRLRMHNLLIDTARGIVCQESLKYPGERSRLRDHEEVLHVLRDCTGTKAVEGLHLELPEPNDEHIQIAAFANMSNLRILHLNNLSRLHGAYITTSKKLKWLCWHRFPLPNIPTDLYMENLVAIDLRYSRLKRIWKGHKRLDRLKFLNLSYSYHLIKTPDFSGVRSLEKLLLNDCTSLVDVHQSIGCLDKLLILNLANCKKLRTVPSGIFLLKSLQHLDLSGYFNFSEQATSKGPVSMFRQLLITKLQDRIPISVASMQGLSGLRRLDLVECNISVMPTEIGNLKALGVLNLEGNKFSTLPSSFHNLSGLKSLVLDNCASLKSLPDLPNNLGYLGAGNCSSLEPESVGLQLDKIGWMNFRNCIKLDYNFFKRKFFEFYLGPSDFFLSLNVSDVPSDFRLQGSGSVMSFIVPPHIGKKIQGWIVCAISLNPRFFSMMYKVVDNAKGIGMMSTCYAIKRHQSEMWPDKHRLFDGSKLEWVSEVDLVDVCKESGVDVESLMIGCGMSVIYQGDNEDLDY